MYLHCKWNIQNYYADETFLTVSLLLFSGATYSSSSRRKYHRSWYQATMSIPLVLPFSHSHTLSRHCVCHLVRLCHSFENNSKLVVRALTWLAVCDLIPMLHWPRNCGWCYLRRLMMLYFSAGGNCRMAMFSSEILILLIILYSSNRYENLTLDTFVSLESRNI